jgi:CheY-like chemotaxis protein
MSAMAVLIVDDDPFVLGFMSARINSWGYEAIPAPSGKDAIARLKERNVGAVVLDYLMPEMNGIVTLEEIRRFNKDVAVIMFTAGADEKSMEDIGRLNISAYIPKSSVNSGNQMILRTALMMIEKKLKKM